MVITNLRNVDGYENMFRQHLEDIITTPSASRPAHFETRKSSPDLDLALKPDVPTHLHFKT